MSRNRKLVAAAVAAFLALCVATGDRARLRYMLDRAASSIRQIVGVDDQLEAGEEPGEESSPGGSLNRG